MDKKFKQQLGLIAFGVALFTALNNLNYISDFLHVCAELLTPVFAGLLMAFILSVPMRGIGKRLSRLMPKASERTINVLSLIITLLLLVAIIVLLCVIAIPQLIASVKVSFLLLKKSGPTGQRCCAIMALIPLRSAHISTSWIGKPLPRRQ